MADHRGETTVDNNKHIHKEPRLHSRTHNLTRTHARTQPRARTHQSHRPPTLAALLSESPAIDEALLSQTAPLRPYAHITTCTLPPSSQTSQHRPGQLRISHVHAVQVHASVGCLHKHVWPEPHPPLGPITRPSVIDWQTRPPSQSSCSVHVSPHVVVLSVLILVLVASAPLVPPSGRADQMNGAYNQTAAAGF